MRKMVGSIAIPLDEQQIAIASSHVAPLEVQSGSYLVEETGEIFNTITKLNLTNGEIVYFATDNGLPFGDLNSGISIAANQHSRDVTQFGPEVPVDGPAGLDAAKLLKSLESRF